MTAVLIVPVCLEEGSRVSTSFRLGASTRTAEIKFPPSLICVHFVPFEAMLPMSYLKGYYARLALKLGCPLLLSSQYSTLYTCIQRISKLPPAFWYVHRRGSLLYPS